MTFDEEQKEFLESHYVRRKDCESYRDGQDSVQSENKLKIATVETQVQFILGGVGLIISMLLPILISVINTN